jgi:hypothetical protein
MGTRSSQHGEFPDAGLARAHLRWRDSRSTRQQEEVMTNPREQREAGTAATAHTEPEVVEDLDVTGDDAGTVLGGDAYLKLDGVQGESTKTYYKDTIG